MNPTHPAPTVAHTPGPLRARAMGKRISPAAFDEFSEATKDKLRAALALAKGEAL